MTADVYVYRAALLCERCGRDAIDELLSDGVEPDEDSDSWPQGPYPDGGWEADCPQHCDHCNEFLRNPLTGDGHDYVRDKLMQQLLSNRGIDGVLEEWRDHYEIAIPLHVDYWFDIDDLPRDCIHDCTVPGADASDSVEYWRRALASLLTASAPWSA